MKARRRLVMEDLPLAQLAPLGRLALVFPWHQVVEDHPLAVVALLSDPPLVYPLYQVAKVVVATLAILQVPWYQVVEDHPLAVVALLNDPRLVYPLYQVARVVVATLATLQVLHQAELVASATLAVLNMRVAAVAVEAPHAAAQADEAC